jgi:hypothetical protein
MSYKSNCSCLEKSKEDEPIFVLCARDMMAPGIVMKWAHLARIAGVNLDKVNEAIQCATEMREWQRKNFTRVPD